MLWAGLNFDLDGDCDVDGVEIFELLSNNSLNITEYLPGMASEFGTVEDCCQPIGVGTPVDGYPNWQERTMIVFTNMVRMAPIEYRETYMADYLYPTDNILSLYPAVAPLHWNYELNQAARLEKSSL